MKDAGRIKINSWTNDRKYIMIDLFGSFEFSKIMKISGAMPDFD